jgi:hypothetical protein
MISEITLLDKLTKAVTFTFKEDKTAPGVTVASLRNGGQYYCSVVRYDGAFAKGKKVVCSATGPTIGAAIKAVADEFLFNTSIKVVKNPLDELSDLIKGV